MITRIRRPIPTRGLAPSHSPPDTHFAPGSKIATGLGWFSIALGLAEVLAPREMARLTGVRQPELIFLYGLREIATGVAILNSSQPAPWVWARVAGDALDLGTLAGPIMHGSPDDRMKAIIAAGAVAGVTALDVLAASELTAGRMAEG